MDTEQANNAQIARYLHSPASARLQLDSDAFGSRHLSQSGDLRMSIGVLAAIVAVVAGALFVAVFRSKGKPKQ